MSCSLSYSSCFFTRKNNVFCFSLCLYFLRFGIFHFTKDQFLFEFLAMDTCLPDWSTDFDMDLPFSNPRKSFGGGNELLELLWENGEVVLHSQNHQKRPKHDPIMKPRQFYTSKNDQSTTCKTSVINPNPSSLINHQEDETVSWIDCPIDESFEKEFYSNFLPEIPIDTSNNPNKPFSPHIEHDKFFNGSDLPRLPRFKTSFGPTQHQQDKLPTKFGDAKGQGHFRPFGEIRECSTLGSSHCGSNQVANEVDMSRGSSCGIASRAFSAGVDKNFSQKTSESAERETLEQTLTSYSGGSGSIGLWKTSNQCDETNNRLKRKSREMEESECQSDATELGSAVANKSSQKSGIARRTRVAEIHNLSERRRRDRINEKMKALQELIPHSSKSDKASMLDEAIEYMKSLQFQLQQLMWMASGMAPMMMLPGMQQYMGRIGMGIGPPALAQFQNLMRLQRFPLLGPAMAMPNQATIRQNPLLNQVNFQNQMQSIPNFSEQFANCMGFHPIQSSSQPINMFNFASHTPLKNQALGPPANPNGSTE